MKTDEAAGGMYAVSILYNVSPLVFLCVTHSLPVGKIAKKTV